MTQENKETLIRASGIIEGLSYVVEQRIADALISASDIIDLVVKSEDCEMHIPIEVKTIPKSKKEGE